jgi:hypothetical protein
MSNELRDPVAHPPANSGHGETPCSLPVPKTIVSKIPESQRSDLGAGLFVWSIWLAALIGLLHFVATYSDNIPYLDEWTLVEHLTGNEPVTLTWLWSQQNEHRMFLTRLIILGLHHVSGAGLHIAMYLDVLLLAALAGGLMWTARKLRGGTSYPDAFFALALLNWGHAENVLMGIQVTFIVPTALACGVLVILVRNPLPSPRAAVLVGATLLLLPLCGANGLVFVPPLALWLAYAGYHFLASADDRRRRVAWLVITLALASLVLVGLYFTDYGGTGARARAPSVSAAANVGVQVLTMSFGWAAYWVWPISAAGVLGLLFVCSAGLARVWRRQPGERLRAAGLLLFLVAVASLSAGIGRGRAGIHELAGFQSRYGVLVFPLAVCVYYASQLYGGQWSRLATMVLFTLACCAYVPNNEQGIEYARKRQLQSVQLERAIYAGMPAVELVRVFTQPPFEVPPDGLLEKMLMLQRSGAKPFRELRGAYVGRLEASDQRTVRGWAWDAARPDSAVGVSVYDGDRLLGTVRADVLREDLAESRKGSGKYGFSFRLPEALCDGKPHVIRVRFAGTMIDLEQSPRGMVCGPSGAAGGPVP